MKAKEIKGKLGMSTVSIRDGIITARQSFFYHMGKSTKTYIDKVKSVFPDAEIIDSGEHYTSFRGGQSVAQGSHWYVKFKLPNLSTLTPSQSEGDIISVKRESADSPNSPHDLSTNKEEANFS